MVEQSVRYLGIDKEIKFVPSPKLPTFDEFWKCESVLGGKHVREHLEKSEYRVDGRMLKRMFETSDVKFLVNEDETMLYSATTGGAHVEYFKDKVHEISAIEAFRKYDLHNLEIAQEKTYSIIPKKEEELS